VDLLFKCLDALENYTDNIVNTGNEGSNEYNDIIKELNDIVQTNHLTEDSKNRLYPGKKFRTWMELQKRKINIRLPQSSLISTN